MLDFPLDRITCPVCGATVTDTRARLILLATGRLLWVCVDCAPSIR